MISSTGLRSAVTTGWTHLRSFSTLLKINKSFTGISATPPLNRSAVNVPQRTVLQDKLQSSSVEIQQTRNRHFVYPKFTKIKFSRETGQAETFEPVVERFFHLNNGLWIRRKAGCNKRKYLKSKKSRVRALQHVVCNRQQSVMLDKFVEDDYKKPHYFPDDPYAHYHKKSNILGYKYVPKKFYP